MICRNRAETQIHMWLHGLSLFPRSELDLFITTGLSKRDSSKHPKYKTCNDYSLQIPHFLLSVLSPLVCLCVKNTGSSPSVSASFLSLSRLCSGSRLKRAVNRWCAPRTLDLYSLRFERNWDIGGSTLTFFFRDASLPLNLRTMSTLQSLEGQSFWQGRRQYPSLWSQSLTLLKDQT